MPVRNLKSVENAGPGPVEEVHIEGLQGGSSTPADGSVTNAMLAGGITADKLAKGVIPTVPGAATAAAAGTVKLAAVTPLVKSADPAAAAGDTVTKAEFDAVVALAIETKATVNALINAQRAAGQAADK